MDSIDFDFLMILEQVRNYGVRDNSDDLKLLNGECESKKIEFLQRHQSRKEELQTMGSLVQFLHQQLSVQRQNMADAVEMMKSGNIN